ncbi:CBS domain-containing protein [Desulforhopalus sp. IMCC35007]|uniref:CBS domain-containing protein n=1 Tax=Desulforhopalus sp. IMCC35007 TaxID=2569543 RepID=UPI00145FC4A2|nr:CBS domain-containing protein [Desulforhopalus sp. IMCC35007]
MLKSNEKNTLSGVSVKNAMRRQFNALPQSTSIDHCINTLLKYKVSGILALDDTGKPSGVLSKTDIIGAYYADLPIESPIEHIMATPPLMCTMEQPLETALEQMRENTVYRLYVVDSKDQIVGTLAYPDIVGLLYKSCYMCEYSHYRKKYSDTDTIKRLTVQDVIFGEVKSVNMADNLFNVLEELSTYRLGAILVVDDENIPVGVVSKTDLIFAYKHRCDKLQPASSIMTSPVQTCYGDDLLEEAVKKMIFSDIHRLFVINRLNDTMDGVFSLTDAARCRSGSCHACMSSRITLEN